MTIFKTRSKPKIMTYAMSVEFGSFTGNTNPCVGHSIGRKRMVPDWREPAHSID